MNIAISILLTTGLEVEVARLAGGAITVRMLRWVQKRERERSKTPVVEGEEGLYMDELAARNS